VESIPLHQLMSVKCIEQRGANVLEVKRASVGGQSTSLQLLTSEVSRGEGFNPILCLDLRTASYYCKANGSYYGICIESKSRV